MSDELIDTVLTPQPRSWYRRLFISTVRVSLLTYLALCLLLVAMESRLVYHPPISRDATQEARALGGEEIWFNAADNTKLHGWFFPAADTSSAVLYFHGNGEDAERNIDLAVELRDRLGMPVFVIDYRGYGHSEGSPNESDVIADGIDAQRWLAEKLNIKTDDIILYGRSLGGGVAVAAAEQLGAKAVVVYGTFANMVDVAAGRYPFVPVRSLMRNPYRSQQRIANYKGPFLQFHGNRDIVVPIELARPLYEAAPCATKRFVEIENGGHNDPLPQFCYDALVEFLDSLP